MLSRCPLRHLRLRRVKKELVLCLNSSVRRGMLINGCERSLGCCRLITGLFHRGLLLLKLLIELFLLHIQVCDSRTRCIQRIPNRQGIRCIISRQCKVLTTDRHPKKKDCNCKPDPLGPRHLYCEDKCLCVILQHRISQNVFAP